jgi:hypothetical protein
MLARQSQPRGQGAGCVAPTGFTGRSGLEGRSWALSAGMLKAAAGLESVRHWRRETRFEPPQVSHDRRRYMKAQTLGHGTSMAAWLAVSRAAFPPAGLCASDAAEDPYLAGIW